jgi:hypothetical protein
LLPIVAIVPARLSFSKQILDMTSQNANALDWETGNSAAYDRGAQHI